MSATAASDEVATMRLWSLGLLCVIVVAFLIRVPLLIHRGFDPDELQHMHGAYCIAQGMTPFVDYYEHHPPLLGWLLSAMVRLLGPQWTTLLAARGLMALLTGLMLWATYVAGRKLSGPRTAMMTVLLLSYIVLFLGKSLEIRPDVPAALCWMAGLATIIRAVTTGRKRDYALGGLALGLGLVFTPKLAFGVIGLGLGLAFTLYRMTGRLDMTLRPLLALVPATCVPLVVVVLILAAQGNLAASYHDVIAMNVGWPRELSATVYLKQFITQNPFIFCLGVLGWGATTIRLLKRRDTNPAIAIPAAAFVTICVGWFIIPVPWPQYLLTLFPLWAFMAADVLPTLANAADRAYERSMGRLSVVPHTAAGLCILLSLVGLGIVAQLRLAGSRPFVHELVESTLWLAGAVLLVARCRSMPDAGRQVGFAVVLVAAIATMMVLRPLTIPFIAPAVILLTLVHLAPRAQATITAMLAMILAGPISQVDQFTRVRNKDMRAEFDTVMTLSAPTDTVLSGWRGCAVFRPHAYRYYFLHEGMLKVLGERQKGADVLAALNGTRPKLVIYDDAVKSLSAEVNAFILKCYVATGSGDIWVRVDRE